MRIYDPRVGRFLSVDPLRHSYPWYTPYQFAGNSPIANIDLDGAEPKPSTSGTQEGQQDETKEEMHNLRGDWTGTKKQTWFWHAGGLITGTRLNKEKTAYENTYSTAGWYTSEEYVEVLSKSYAVQALAFDLNLLNYTSEQNYKSEIKKGHEELQKFAGSGINQQAAAHLLAAAKQTAGENNFHFTGTTYFAPINIEDFIGLGAIAKMGFKNLAARTIYRVMSPEEAADVLVHGFRQAPIETKIASYEGKLFWQTGKDAKWYQNWVGKNNPILKVKVDKGFIFEAGTDVGKKFYYVSPEKLEEFNNAVISIQKLNH